MLERWTPVTSGLPIDDDLVLIVDDRKTVVGYFDANANDGLVWRDFEGYPLRQVSHWAPMPLPSQD